MTEDTNDMLLKIRTFLRRDDEASRELWNVLTALRGPDDEATGALKDATTGVVRTRLLGLDAGWENGNQRELNGDLFGEDEEKHVKFRVAQARTHFVVHAQRAFRVLGLVWGEINQP